MTTEEIDQQIIAYRALEKIGKNAQKIASYQTQIALLEEALKDSLPDTKKAVVSIL